MKMTEADIDWQYAHGVASTELSKAQAEVERLRTMTEWKPFETAPKIGEFLVYMPEEHRQFQVMYRTGRLSVIGGAFAFDLTKPTLWSPIPALPDALPKG